MTSPYMGKDDALAFIVEQRSPEIIQMATEQSVALATFRTIPVGTRQMKVNLLDALPSAQWLTATPPADVDIAVKPITEMSWKTQDIYVEEAATIVIIPENVLDDSEVNLWTEVQARCAEQVAKLIDQTIFFGTAPTGSVPASFPVGGIVGRAIAAGHEYEWGTAAPGEDIAEAWNQTMQLVEADGFDISESYASRVIRGQLRGLRDSMGTPLYVTNLAGGGSTDAVYGIPIHYVTNGIWDNSKAMAVMGDAKLGVIAMRQKLTPKKLDQATIGTINLPLQDALALRLKIRLGFGVLVPKGVGQSANPYPFAVLAPKTAVAASGATSGQPGAFTPAGSEVPATFAGMSAITATPATAWSSGSYVVLGDGSYANWNSTTWVAGKRP